MLTKSTGGTVVIAHRGGGDLFPENTVEAFIKSQELGVDAAECDVQTTRDGKLVVIHDPDLMRTAGVEKKVEDLTLDEIRKIRLKDGSRIPTLEEVFESVKISLVVELKSELTIRALSELFRNNPQYIQRSAVISFFHGAVKIMSELYPELMTGVLLAGFPVDPGCLTKAASSKILALNYEGLTREYVDLCHRKGIAVSVWTPNGETEIRKMIDIGVDSIATDRPDIALKLLGR